MKTKVGLFVLAIVSVAALGILAGCAGDSELNPVPTGSVQVMVVDAPANDIVELHLRLTSVQLGNRSAPVVEVLGPEELPADLDVIAAGETPVILGTAEVNEGPYTYANLVVDPASPVNRVRTSDGTVHPLTMQQEGVGTANLDVPIRVVAGGEMTLLFDFAAAASVRETINGWVLTPRIFSRGVGMNPQFGAMAGVVTEVDSEPLTSPDQHVLGVFIRDDGNWTVALAEVDPATGEYRVPKLLPGRYRVTAQMARATDWKPVGDPLFDQKDVLVTADQDKVVNIEIDL